MFMGANSNCRFATCTSSGSHHHHYHHYNPKNMVFLAKRSVLLIETDLPA